MKTFIIQTPTGQDKINAGTILAALTSYQLDNPGESVTSIRDTSYDDLP